MDFLNSIFLYIQDFLESLFASSSPEFKKKHQLKQIASSLKTIDPPLYRADGVILPSFPQTLYQIAQFMVPVRDTLKATIANPDHRAAERYRDFLIELVLTEDQRKQRASFTFAERSAALVAQKMNPDRVIEEQGKQFAQFLKILDSSQVGQAGLLLERVDTLVDFCQFNFNNFFSYFDPAFKAHAGHDTTVESPSFHPVEVTEIIPVLLDLYYIMSRLDMSAPVIDVVTILDARKNNTPLTEETKNRVYRLFQAILWLLQKRVSKEVILAIVRVTKEDPEFSPEQPTIKNDYIAQYKNRIPEFFHSDSRKLLKEKQQNEMQTLIDATFGNLQLATISGYNETTNTLLQEFTPLSLDWIQPLEIIRTFTRHFFSPHFKTILRSVIVEGYFNNRSLQSSLSSAYYYCESVEAKIAEFENLFADNQPCSLKILTGYLTELEKGMDFEKPLRKMVENMNGHAKNLIQQAVTQYAEVYNFSTIILEDNKKTVPEYITNIRTLSLSTKNSDSFASLEKEIGVFRNFLEIMKKYAIVGTLSVHTSLAEQTES